MQAEAQQVGKRYVVPLTLILAFTTGPFAALLVLPLLRAARCAWAVLHPSFEASIEEHSPGASAGMPLSAPAATRAAIALAAVAPAFALLLWVTPVAEGLLGLDATERAAAQGAALMLSGAAPLYARNMCAHTKKRRHAMAPLNGLGKGCISAG